ncbi:peptidoglycan-binding protein LysM [Streptomyces fumigatiscleroticus]|nr:peptidoglycan-binding protein LysM [Streptomyces fumigatiscleroticus]
MLSGNGRHRRPRQAPALVVAAGVTGSAIAIPLLGATGAGAADGTAWDRVAECASGGAWSENSGNGYYGGLQISQDDWEKYGGSEYAESADRASRSQQISVAEKILADQGIAAWPTCGLLAGLDKDSASVDVDTGVADDGSPDTSSASGESGESGSSKSSNSSKSSESSDSSKSSGSSKSSDTSDSDSSGSSKSSDAPSFSSSSSPEESSDKTGEAGKSDNSSGSTGSSGSSGSSGSQAPEASPTVVPKRDDAVKSEQGVGLSSLVDTGALGTGRHRGASADEEAADNRDSASLGRHASRGETAARDTADGTYTVRSGDTLCTIADSLDVDGGWRALYAANKQDIGTDPDRIVPGQTLALSGEPVEG